MPVRPGTITVIGRGQVHVFEEGEALDGAVVRFSEETLAEPGARRGTPAWLLAGRGGRTVDRAARRAARGSTRVIDALGAELDRPPDEHSPELQRHLLSTILLWIERWYDASRTERRDDRRRRGPAAPALHPPARARLPRAPRRRALRGRARHAARGPSARALSQVTGRSTKELVTDRVMLEAAWLLRYTDDTVGEVAHRAGFADPLYFSRAFKRHAGEPPVAYRERGAREVHASVRECHGNCGLGDPP